MQFKSLLLVFPVHCFHLCHKICTDRAIVVLCGQLLCMCDKEAGKVMTLSHLAEDIQVLRFTPYAHLTDSRVFSKATESTKVAEPCQTTYTSHAVNNSQALSLNSPMINSVTSDSVCDVFM